jgi:hypothetical protein
LKDEQEKVTILKSVAERDSSQTNAAFGAGMLLLSSNKPDEGIQFIRKAIANQRDPEAVMNYAGRTLDALEERNCPLSSQKNGRRSSVRLSTRLPAGRVIQRRCRRSQNSFWSSWKNTPARQTREHPAAKQWGRGSELQSSCLANIQSRTTGRLGLR